jgi:hypothetical protein
MKNLFILFLTTLASVSMMAEVSVSDKTVLLKLYTATMVLIEYGVGFIFPVSTWYGIKLEGDKIVSINLSDNNLVGEIPNEIVSLRI